MKDLENRHGGFISKVKSLAREEGVAFFYFDRLKEIGEKSGYPFNEKLVGAGQECVVVTDQETTDVVVAFTYKDLSAADAKQVFYTQRIFSTLFPYNFPQFYAAYSGQHARTVRQRICRAESSLAVKYPFSRVLQEVVFNWRLSGMLFDGAAFNYVRSSDGGEYYLDRIALESYDKRRLLGIEVQDKISCFMKNNSFSETLITVVQGSIARLDKLE